MINSLTSIIINLILLPKSKNIKNSFILNKILFPTKEIIYILKRLYHSNNIIDKKLIATLVG